MAVVNMKPEKNNSLPNPIEPAPLEIVVYNVLEQEDKRFLEEFLYSYRIVATPLQLIGIFISIYDNTFEGSSKTVKCEKKLLVEIKLKVVKAILLWMDLCSTDFCDDRLLYKRLETFISTASVKKESANLSNAIQELDKKLKVKFLQRWRSSQKFPGPLEPSSSDNRSIILTTNFKEEEAAQQITLIHHEMMSKIKPKEFLKQAWNKSGKETKAPNVLACINRFNLTTRWYATLVLEQELPDKRAQVLSTLIKIAEKLEAIRNYNGLMEIISGLHSVSISRLKQSWKLVPNKVMELFNQLSELMTPNRNYQNYRKQISKVEKGSPFVPFIVVFLTDFTFMDEANPDYVEDNKVNFAKLSLFGNRLKEFKAFQAMSYNFRVNPNIQEAMNPPACIPQDDELYNLSKFREAPGEAEGDETGRSRSVTRGITNEFYRTSKRDLAETDGLSEEGNRSSIYKMFQNGFNIARKSTIVAEESMSARDWQLLLTGAKTVTYKQGDVIIPQGVINETLYRVQTGSVEIQCTREDGKKETLTTLSAPDTIGEMSVVGGQTDRTTASVVAGTETVVLHEMQFSFVNQLLHSEPELAERFYKQIARKLSQHLKTQNDDRHKKAETKANTPEEAKAPKTSDLQQDLDAKFRKRFQIPDTDEVVIKEYNCLVKNAPTMIKGKLFVSQHYLCFYTNFFHIKKKQVIPFKSIAYISNTGADLTVTTKPNKKRLLRFPTDSEGQEATEIILKILERTQQDEPSPKLIETKKMEELNGSDGLSHAKISGPGQILTPKDWDLLLTTAKLVSYKRGDIILKDNEESHCIYQIVRGCCSVRKLIGGSEIVLCMLKVNDTFGEISFIDGSLTCADVVSESDEVDLNIIEGGYFLRVLFDSNPGLGARFYHYLTCVLSKRLKRKGGD